MNKPTTKPKRPRNRVGSGELVRRSVPLGSDLWMQLGMADEGGSVEIYKTKEDEAVADQLRVAGLITGKRWAKLTPLGTRVLNRTSA